MHIRSFLVSLLFLFFLFFRQGTYGQTAAPLVESNIYNEQQIIYNTDTILHTAWKPILYIDTPRVSSGSWFHRKFFQEHLLEVKQPNFNINADVIFDEYIGYSKRPIPTIIHSDETTHVPSMNTRGFEIFGNVSSKFYFESAFYENQGRFGGYVDSFIRQRLVVPGQSTYKNLGNGKGFDFSASSTRLIFIPSKHFAFDLGYGKNFIGDGYRSMLLSDWSYNYPYFKASTTWGKFQYNAMWSQYISQVNRIYDNKESYFRKWAQTFLIDWKATKRLSVGVFETVVWPDQDSMRNKDMSPWIASPIIFLHGKESPSGVKNNVIIGTNLKYHLLKYTYLYGQFALDSTGSSGSGASRYAAQVGIRSGNTFGVKNLNTILEGNLARPYTYASPSRNTNYAHDNQPLAHPLGANFKEGLLMAEYTYKTWRFRFESFVANYGVDSSREANYGHDIFKPTDTHSVTNDATIGEGISTNIFYADLKIAYILNPATNMRIETGITYRNEKNSIATYKDRIFYIGIRMSFRRIGYDF